jgi:hypothetical protein
MPRILMGRDLEEQIRDRKSTRGGKCREIDGGGWLREMPRILMGETNSGSTGDGPMDIFDGGEHLLLLLSKNIIAGMEDQPHQK